jgi:hypothetical protein
MEGFYIWIVIMIVVGISKLIEKAKQAAASDTQQTETRRSRPRPSPTVRPATVRPPPPVIKPQREAWEVDEDELRRFLGEMSGEAEVERAPPPLPPPVTAWSQPEPAVEVETPAPAMRKSDPAMTAFQQTAETPSRAAQWAAAMRDPNNLRNSVIAAEILGPPRAFTDA